MTTTVTITHDGPGHHNVNVYEVDNVDTEQEETLDAIVLKPGDSKELLVYDSRTIFIEEGDERAAPKQAKVVSRK